MQSVRVQAGSVNVEGLISIPESSRGIVVVTYPSSSDRNRPRSQHLAEELNEHGLGVLLLDLFTDTEEMKEVENPQLRFNIPLLADRIVGSVDWLARYEPAVHLKVGLMGTSTSAAAAIVAAAGMGSRISAIVSRGGRPDLAGDALKHVIAPILLIVGENDPPVLELNKSALSELEGEKRLEVIPGASHHFTETGVFELAAHAARKWFVERLQ
jgi:putative phosphoribosyl transferase